MVAILFEEDQHSREVLRKMLNHFGYTTVLSSTNLNEAMYYVKKYGKNINLIVFGAKPDEGVDLPFSRLVIQNPDLHLAPLILLTNLIVPFKLSGNRSWLSRIDALISKPFGLNRFEQALAEANKRRSTFRHTLIYFGKSQASLFSESVSGYHSGYHWRKFLNASTPQELESLIAKEGFHLGGILVADDAPLDEVTNRVLTRFKKSPLGSITPLAMLSHDPQKTQYLKQTADLFIEEKNQLSPTLALLSERCLNHWQRKSLLRDAKELLAQKKWWSAKSKLKKVIHQEADNWEAKALLGTLFLSKNQTKKAIDSLEEALLTQPCSPFIYLSLAKLKTGASRDEVLSIAKSYCPHHPQIQEISHSKGEA